MPRRKPKAKELVRLETQYHEAGHAVATCKTGGRFELVTVVRDHEEGYLGSVEPVYPEEIRRKECEGFVISLLAGGIAQRLGTGEEPNQIDVFGDDFMLPNFISGAIGEEASRKESGAYRDWMYLHTERLLKRPDWWLAIEMVAAELLKRG